jgi:tRNA-Thr(GGU) m(6)t(6)A37 methyltransferase TsaA
VIGITAQVSLYPLRQESLSPAIDDALETFREHGLHVEPGSMSSLIVGDDAAIFAALQNAFRLAAEQGQVVMTATFSNACRVPRKEDESVTYRAIGRVENDFDEPTPPEKMRAAESRIVLDPTLTEGLKGLEPSRQIMVVFYFHRSGDYDLCQHPQGDRSRPQRGVFALRSPRRPNPIGVTVVDLVAIAGNVLQVRGLDAINGTPVLDLKPV